MVQSPCSENGKVKAATRLVVASDRDELIALGSMLRDPAIIADAAQVVRPEDFRPDAHQQVFRAMLDLLAHGKPVLPSTVFDWLGTNAARSGVRPDYIAEIWEAAATGAAWEHYAGAVREASILRHLDAAGKDIQHDAEHPTGPASEVLESAERRIFDIARQGMRSDIHRLSPSISEAWDRLDARKKGEPLPGVQTGYPDLDAKLGSLANGSLVIVGARPSIGKTALAVNFARNAILQGLPLLFVSLEQSNDELHDRLLCCDGRVDSNSLRHSVLSPDECWRFKEAGERLRSSGEMLTDDCPCQGMLRISSNARRIKATYGIRLVIVDYLQLVEPDNRKEPRQEQVAGISRRLKGLARELNVPVLALAQLNRAAEDRSRPRLSDLRESGGIEADADTVILLHRPAKPQGVIELDVAKQRNGPTGTVALTFLKNCMRFESCAEHYEPEI